VAFPEPVVEAGFGQAELLGDDPGRLPGSGQVAGYNGPHAEGRQPPRRGSRLVPPSRGQHHVALAADDAGGDVLRLRVPQQDAIDPLSEIIGQPVRVLRFEEMSYEEEFDGIWACASLLHVPRSSIDDVLARLTRALRSRGVVYASFKVGEAEQVRGGRLFNDYSEESLEELFRRHPGLEFVRTWRTEDLRPPAGGQCWLNVLARKGRAEPQASL
jgi:hypothetical protein